MKSRQFHTYKFKSSRLKEFKYNIQLSFDEAQEYGEVIALFDNQILRSIRDIHERIVDFNTIDDLHKQIDKLNRKSHSDENIKLIKKFKKEINDSLFIPEYITIEMTHPSHYKHMYKNGLIVNDKKFIRFSCSAGQARVSTVVFVEEGTASKLDEILNNGRDMNKDLVPSKFNAYKGVYGSATQVVTTPRIALVSDYYSETSVNVNYVTETPCNQDDDIDIRTITENFNRFDGQGLISYEMASKWAKDLGLDYVPAQWCVRNSYLKGMLNTFPIQEFCEIVNNGNYRFKTSYKDENGDFVVEDIRNVDVLLSESMMKLWDSFPSIEVYEKNCEDNNLHWGVSLYSPKKDKDILKMNYQFLQTLDLNKQDIEKVCGKFVDWITGVTSENVYYTILFLLGTDITEEKIIDYLNNGENFWIKSLIVNPKLIHDKYIKKKVYDLMKRKIKNGCLGQILVDGNFQTIVSDPYAMMQHIMGLEVTGLLGKKEYYSNYWNEKGVKVVDSMRAPLTYRSEHLLLDLKQNKETDYWYRYNYSGIIVNVHGHETMNWAGSDFDFDILATTSDETIIKSVYKNELPVYYEPPKSKKVHISNDDLFNADLFSFGSIIGSITNKSTSAFALLPTLHQGSDEWETTLNRIKMCTKLQSAQIDKAKIGREVKGIPSNWINYQKVLDEDSLSNKENKEFLNSILLDKHPYFFTYLYKGTKNKYKKHVQSYDITCRQRFNMSLEELKSSKRLNKEQREFLKQFEMYSPVIDSDCVMNNICRYIESVDFKIKDWLKSPCDDLHELLSSCRLTTIDDYLYKQIKSSFNEYKSTMLKMIPVLSNDVSIKDNFDKKLKTVIDTQYELLKDKMTSICSDNVTLVDYLIHLFYIDEPNSNKEILWNLYGSQLFENIKNNTKEKIYIPVSDEVGNFTYLDSKYSLKEVSL